MYGSFWTSQTFDKSLHTATTQQHNRVYAPQLLGTANLCTGKTNTIGSFAIVRSARFNFWKVTLCGHHLNDLQTLSRHPADIYEVMSHRYITPAIPETVNPSPQTCHTCLHTISKIYCIYHFRQSSTHCKPNLGMYTTTQFLVDQSSVLG